MATFTAAKERGKHRNVAYKTHESMRKIIAYIYNPEKCPTECMKGYNLNPETAYEEMLLNKMNYNKAKEDGKRRMVVHFIQSFNPGELDEKLASEIADKFLQHEYFKGFNIAYATHTDKPHIHTHFVIDTVNKDTGIMWHFSKEQLQDLKDWNDTLCEEYGLSVLQHNGEKTRYKARGQIEAEKDGRSWVRETELAVNDCMSISKNKTEFISNMSKLGYKVGWTDTREYITFTDKNGNKIRNKTLDNEKCEGKGEYTGKYSKENLLKQFALNKQVKGIETENNPGVVLDADNAISNIIKMAHRNAPYEEYPLQRIHGDIDNITYRKEREKEREKGSGFEWE